MLASQNSRRRLGECPLPSPLNAIFDWWIDCSHSTTITYLLNVRYTVQLRLQPTKLGILIDLWLFSSFIVDCLMLIHTFEIPSWLIYSCFKLHVYCYGEGELKIYLSWTRTNEFTVNKFPKFETRCIYKIGTTDIGSHTRFYFTLFLLFCCNI